MRPGAGPFSPFSGQYYMASNAHSTAYKRLGKTVDLTGDDSGELTFKFSSDLEQDWDFMMVEAHVLDDDADASNDVWTTLPDTDGHTDTETGDSCAEGLANGSDAAAPVAAALLQRGVRADGRDRHGRVERLHGQLRGLAGLDRRPDAVRGQAGRAVHHQRDRLGHAGARHVDRRRRRSRSTAPWWSRPTSRAATAGGSPPPPPEGTEFDDANWTRATQQFTEGGIVGTTDTIYTGFGFEGMNAAARPEFMKRALKYLGVIKDDARRREPRPGQPGGNPPAAARRRPSTRRAKLKSGKRLRADQRRARCASAWPAPVTPGRPAPARSGSSAASRRYGSKAFTIAAGKTATVSVQAAEVGVQGREAVQEAARRCSHHRAAGPTPPARGSRSSRSVTLLRPKAEAKK